jgi:hypothetical protein
MRSTKNAKQQNTLQNDTQFGLNFFFVTFRIFLVSVLEKSFSLHPWRYASLSINCVLFSGLCNFLAM